MEEPSADSGSKDWKSHVDLQQRLNKHLGAEEEMEKAAQPERTVLNRRNAENSDAHYVRFHTEHLKPLSIYSRVITSDNKTNRHHSTNYTSPFINLKIDLLNRSLAKRKLDDSCLDDSYDTPAKKPYGPTLHSPDLGCFVDCREDLVSPAATSKPALLDATTRIRSSWKESVKSQLHWDHEEHGRSEESGNTERRIAPHTVMSKNLIPVAFDCDVNDFFSLKRCGSERGGGRPDAVESRQSDADGDTPQNKPVSCNPAHRRGSERGEEEKPDVYLNVKDKEEDDGARFTLSRQKDPRTGKRASQPGDAEVPQATSSPLLRTGRTEMPGNELRSKTSSERDCRTRAAGSCSPTVHGSHLVPLGCAMESVDGDAEELWSIGAPLFESSVCYGVTEKPEVCIERAERAREEAEGSVVYSINEEGEVSSQSTFLQVQVKSVVCVPNHQAARSKTAAEKEVEPAESIRDGMRQRKRDWEREKRLYVDSVTRHLNENSAAGDGAMTEMLNLMAHVAHREYGAPGRRWQHPSDLTRSNYQRRFGNQTTRMSLHEWRSRNGPALERFANMPKIFERSPIP